MKKLVILLILLIIFSYPVAAFSFNDLLNKFKERVTSYTYGSYNYVIKIVLGKQGDDTATAETETTGNGKAEEKKEEKQEIKEEKKDEKAAEKAEKKAEEAAITGISETPEEKAKKGQEITEESKITSETKPEKKLEPESTTTPTESVSAPQTSQIKPEASKTAQAKETCQDSDGGRVYNVQGTITKGATSLTDYCKTTAIIIEYYCQANKEKSETYTCSTGICQNGACQVGCEAGVTGKKRCSGNELQEEYQNNDCTITWRTKESCTYGCNLTTLSCNAAPSCTNDCNSGEKRCNNNYLQICNNYDTDTCLEWPSSTSGSGNTLCEYGCNSTIFSCNAAPQCLANFTGIKRCSGDILQGEYQNTDCTKTWKNIETCQYGCNLTTLLCNTPSTCAAGTYKIQATGIIFEQGGDYQITNLNVSGCCPALTDCADTSGNCKSKTTFYDVDNDNDKDYCHSSNKQWYEVDSYKIGLANNYPISSSTGDQPSRLCDVLIGTGKWNLGGDAVSAKNDKLGYDHCCGDDSNEYKITGTDGSVACCSKQDATVANGICSLKVNITKPDLIVSQFNINTTTIYADEPFKVNIYVKNIGDAVAPGSINTGLRLYKNGEYMDGMSTYQDLNPGEEKLYLSNSYILTAGEYILDAFVDWDNRHNELNENNNHLIKNITVLNRIQVSNCTDSDGLDYYIKGNLTYTNNPYGITTTFDSCESNNTLNEGICNSQTEYTQNIQKYNCEYGCKDGACITKPTNITNATISGACVVQGINANLPLPRDPDIGTGYAKMHIEGVNDITILKEVCTDTIYNLLMDDYCKSNNISTQWTVATYKSFDAYDTTTCAASGCNLHECLKNITTTDTTPPKIEQPLINPPSGVIGTIFTISAKVTDESSIKNVIAHIQNPDGSDISIISLYDDGAHGDSNLNDSVYGNVWDSSNKSSGVYYIDISASDIVGNEQLLDNILTFNITEAVQQKCISIINNGDPATKLDVVFIPDGYTVDEYDLFLSEVKKHIDESGLYSGLLSREPFSSNKNKINFYLVKEFNNLGCGTSYCSASTIQQAAGSYCPYDEIIVMTKNYGIGYAYPAFHIAVTGGVVSFGPKVTSHEFGHSFGNLGDEYSFEKESVASFAYPNCDYATCPEWCTGSPVPFSEYPLGDGSLHLCANLTTYEGCYNSKVYITNGIYSLSNETGSRFFDLSQRICTWVSTKDTYLNSNCISRFNDNFNIGVNCIPNSGCYKGCGNVDSWRSSESSIMNDPYNTNEFNEVSKRQLLSLLNNYS